MRKRAAEERGDVMIFTAVFIIIILAVAAFVVDVGTWYHTQRRAQLVADSAALAGAQLLGTGGATSSGCTTPTGCAETYVSPNNLSSSSYEGSCNTDGSVPTAPTASNPWVYCVTTPYNNDAGRIEVTVSGWEPGFFSNVVGLMSNVVSRTAVATRSSTQSAPYAIFAEDSTCSGGGNVGVLFNNKDNTVQGAVYSNGAFTDNNGPQTLGVTTYGAQNGCTFKTQAGDTFNGGTTLTQGTSNLPYPVDYSQSPPPCPPGESPNTGSFSFNTGGTASNPYVIPSGIYCAQEIAITGQYVEGNVTFYGQSIAINNQHITLTPYYYYQGIGLLAYQTTSGNWSINVANLSLPSGGTFFGPLANLTLTGSGISGVTAFFEAYTDQINNTNLNLTGYGPATTSWATGSSLLQ